MEDANRYHVAPEAGLHEGGISADLVALAGLDDIVRLEVRGSDDAAKRAANEARIKAAQEADRARKQAERYAHEQHAADQARRKASGQ